MGRADFRFVELLLTAFVYGVAIHILLLGFERYLTRYKGVEQAVFFFFSQAIAGCIRVAWGLFIRFVLAALEPVRPGARDRDQEQEDKDHLLNETTKEGNR